MMAGIRLALWCVPYPSLRPFLERRRDARLERRPNARRAAPSRIAWHVRVASSVIPRSNCLVQALVAEQLLANAGYSSLLKFGVARTENAGLSAHAWIECDGRVLVGGDTSPFSALESIDRRDGV
jgi:hypothetical protein